MQGFAYVPINSSKSYAAPRTRYSSSQTMGGTIWLHVPPGAPLPDPPRIALRVHRDKTAGASASGGFLNLKRVEVIARYPSGEESAPFAYDMCDRASFDAVVVLAHFVREGVRNVFLRSCVRPPLTFRDLDAPDDAEGSLWETVAGLIDPGESPSEAAARELEEELGFAAPADALQALGPYSYPAPGIIGERHVYYHLEVDPRSRRTPSEDGSALEKGASVVALPLASALAHARAGRLRDAKTELALRRLAEVFP
jgi:ADP-ribose pyrophosphatase